MNKKQALKVLNAVRAIEASAQTLETVANESFRTGPYTYGNGNVRYFVDRIRAAIKECSDGEFIRAAREYGGQS